MRYLILVLFVYLGSAPAYANTVYFCKSDVFAEIKDGQVTEYADIKFKMNVSETTVKMSNGGFFDGQDFDVLMWVSPTVWQAQKEYGATISFYEGNLNFTYPTFEQIVAIAATCDKF